MPRTRTSVKEAQTRRLERAIEFLSQKTLALKRRFQALRDRRQVSSRKFSVRPRDVQEDTVLDRVDKEPEAQDRIPEGMSLWYSVLLTAILTAAIALFSAGMVFSPSSVGNVPRLLLELPQTLESFFWRNQKTEVKAVPDGKKAGSLAEEAAADHGKTQIQGLGGESTGKYGEEEIRSGGQELRGKLSQEERGEVDKHPTYEHRILESPPTRVVTVQKGDTVSRILKRQFGESGKILMGAVRELNPEIEDLDLIRVGQKIRLPLNLEVADEIQRIRGRSDLSIGE